MEKLKYKQSQLSFLLQSLLDEGLNFDYRHIIQFDNSIPGIAEALRHNENVHGSVLVKEGRTKNIEYPATLIAFQRDSVEYKYGSLRGYIISKAYVLNDHIIDIINNRGEIVNQCGKFGIKRLNIVFIDSLTSNNYDFEVSDEAPYVKYTFYNAETFLEEGLHLLDEKNTLFIFLSVPWNYLKFKFQYHSIILSGGSHTRRELLSPVEWRLANYLTFILNVNFENLLDKYYHYYRENKESIIRKNFRIQYKKIITVIRSSYELNDAMMSVGNIDINKILGESMGLLGSKLKWNLIFNKLFKVTLHPGYMSITVKDEQREFITKIIENLNKGRSRRKNNPFYADTKSIVRLPHYFNQIISYSTYKEIDLFKYQGEK